MTYGHGIRASAFRDDPPRVRVVAAAQAWRRLDGDRRLALIEQSLNPANDRHPAL